MGRCSRSARRLLIENYGRHDPAYSARRAGSVELSVVKSNTRKAMPPRSHVDCRVSKEARGGGRRIGKLADPHSLACASRPIVFSIRLRRSAGVSVAPVNGTRTTSEAARRTTGVSESVYDHCDPFGTQRKPTHCGELHVDHRHDATDCR